MKCHLKSSQFIDQQEGQLECIELILDASLTQVIVMMCLLNNKQLAERDIFCYVANIFCEFTQFVIFEYSGQHFHDGQVIYSKSQYQKIATSMSTIMNQMTQGFYIKFTIKTGSSYTKQLKDVEKINNFIKTLFKRSELDDLYDFTVQWIKENLVE